MSTLNPFDDNQNNQHNEDGEKYADHPENFQLHDWAKRAMTEMEDLPVLPEPRHSRPPRPHHPALDNEAVRWVLDLDGLTGLLDTPVSTEASMLAYGAVRPAVSAEKYARLHRATEDAKAQGLVSRVAYLHALAGLKGVTVRDGEDGEVYVHPVVKGVGTLATLTAYTGEATRRAYVALGDTDEEVPLYSNTQDQDGNPVWPVLIPGVDLGEEYSQIFQARPGDPLEAADLALTAAPIPAGVFVRLVTEAGFSVATPDLCLEANVLYRGPGAGEAVDLESLRAKGVDAEPERWRPGNAAQQNRYTRAQAHALTSLMVHTLVPDYYLADAYPWRWGSAAMDTTAALAEITEAEEVLQKVEKENRMERIKRANSITSIAGDVEMFAPAGGESEDLTLVPHLVARGQTTAVTGPQGGGKSGVFRELAATLATEGHQFAGQFTATETGPVLLFDLENNAAAVAAYRREDDGLEPATIVTTDHGVRSKRSGEVQSFPAVLAKAADGNLAARETVTSALAARGPYVAVLVDGFKRLVELAGYTEKQEEHASRLVRGLQELAEDLTAGAGTLVVSTHTTRNDEITSGVAIDRYADIIVRLRTSAKPGVTPGPTHRRTLESGKRADMAGGPLARTRLALEDGALVLDPEPVSSRTAKADVELVDADGQAVPDPLEAAVLAVAPAAGEPGVGMRKLTEAAGERAGVSRLQIAPVVLGLVERGVLTDKATTPQGARSDYAYYARAARK